MMVRAAEEAEFKETMSAVKPVVVAGGIASGLAIGLGVVGAAAFLQNKELACEKIRNQILVERADNMEARLRKGQQEALNNLFDTPNTEYCSDIIGRQYQVERDIRDKALDFDMRALDPIYDEVAHMYDTVTVPEISDSHRRIIDIMNRRNGVHIAKYEKLDKGKN